MKETRISEADLMKIKTALERPTLKEACIVMESALSELGFEMVQAGEPKTEPSYAGIPAAGR